MTGQEPGAAHAAVRQLSLRQLAEMTKLSQPSLSQVARVKAAIRGDHRLSDARQAALIAVYDSVLRD